MLGECVDQRGEAELVFEQRGDVVEEDPGLGKIRYFTNQLLQRLAIDPDVLLWPSLVHCGLHHLPCPFNLK